MASDRVTDLCLAYSNALDSGDTVRAESIRPELEQLLRFRYAMTYENGVRVGPWVYFVSVKGGIERVPVINKDIH